MRRKNAIDGFGLVSLLLVCGLLGLNQALIKITNQAFEPLFQTALRSTLAVVPVCLWIILRKGSFWYKGALYPGLVLGLFFAVEFIFLFTALAYTSVARASLFFYSMPFWLAISAHFFLPDERMGKTRFVGLCLAMVGLALAFWDREQLGLFPHQILGDVLALGASFCWLGIALFSKIKGISGGQVEKIFLYQLVFSALLLLPILVWRAEPWIVGQVTPVIMGTLLFQAVVVVAFGYLFWLWLLTVYPASDMAAFSFLSPLIGAAFGWLLLGETISPLTALAFLFVVIGIYATNKKAPQTT